mmetsp:Transcript_24487/g.40404  ORF Transcript_24487/g.40404 Transcript_24487/m.40404 type:complete len:116 (-) Transcript_24487:243-590(-)
MPRKVVQHVVIFKLENFSNEQLELAVKQTAAMAESIPGILAASFAQNADADLYDTYRPYTGGFTHTLLVTFTDAQALKAYDTHPVHLELGKMVIPLMKEAIATDTVVDTFPDLPS